MAVPVINTTQSVLGYLQHQRFEFQPFATNSPTWWLVSALPAGISLDPETGLISGTANWPGVYVFSLQATATPKQAPAQQVIIIQTLPIAEGGSYSLVAHNPSGGSISIIVPGPEPSFQTLHVASIGEIAEGGFNLIAYTPSGATLEVAIPEATSVTDAVAVFAAEVAAASDDWTWTEGDDHASGTITCKHSGAPTAGPVLNLISVPLDSWAEQGWRVSVPVPGGVAMNPASWIHDALAAAVTDTPSFILSAVPGMDGAYYLTCVMPGVAAVPQVTAVGTETITAVTVYGHGALPPGNPLWSVPVVFTMGIEASAEDLTSGISAAIDLNTREITFDGLAAPSSSSTTVTPLIAVKRGDDLMLNLRFVKNGSVCDLPLASLKFGLKEIEPDNLILSSDVWAKTGDAATARYKLHVSFKGDDLDSALGNYEGDTATFFAALGEIEWTETVDHPATNWPATLRGSTKTFLVGVVRDLVPDA